MNAKKRFQDNVVICFFAGSVPFIPGSDLDRPHEFLQRAVSLFLTRLLPCPIPRPSWQLTNYFSGVAKTGFFPAFGYSLFITVFSVCTIVVFTSMTAWGITRVKSRFSTILYYLLVFSMIVPFQMVMFTMSKMANILHLDNPVGIIVIYLGFGAGLSVFIFSGFIKSIPHEIEEAATIDGCNPIQTFFLIVFPILQPVFITVAILNTMWIWNDYLLPYLVIGSNYRTIPIAVQYLQGGYGSRDMGPILLPSVKREM